MLRIGVVLLLTSLFVGSALAAEPAGVWTPARANAWYKSRPWMVGCNFGPSTAVNQLEMWQADTFDLPTIDRELGWAEQLGFNSVRVFLHYLPYKEDSKGFLERLDKYLAVADKHHIATMFVLFDSCWDPFPQPGKQRAPRPYLHNSGWVQCPGQDILRDPSKYDVLKGYVEGVVGRFRNDNRVNAWDIFNEPDNPNTSSYGKVELKNKPELALQLLTKAFAWARAAKPSQPLTSAVWAGQWGDASKLTPMARMQLEESDVISFHNYGKPEEMAQRVQSLRRYNRPILCSEYMARPEGSTFNPVLSYLRDQKVGAYNWGFVAGKTQTIYAWDSWQQTPTTQPTVWFHDIFRPDGTAYRPEEVQYIREITGAVARTE